MIRFEPDAASLIAALRALENLRDDPDARIVDAGLCESAAQLLAGNRRASRWIREEVGLWPKRTSYERHELSRGDEFAYPVPGGVSAYRKAAVNQTMWIGEYGALRLELVDWLIERAKAALSPPASGTRIINPGDTFGLPFKLKSTGKRQTSENRFSR